MSGCVTASERKRLLSWVHENKDGESSEVGLASSLYDACLRTLGLLSQHYLARSEPSRESKARILESHTHLCLFGDEILLEGALEHCLKGDHDLRDEILNLLYALGKTLLQGLDNLYHVQGPADTKTKAEFVLGLATLVENASIVVSQPGGQGDDLISDSDCSEDEASELECEIKRPTDEDNILSALDTYTTSLMDIRPVLEQSLSDISKPSARRAGIPPPEFHVSESAQPYVLKVHDKFRKASSALVKRLGEANWQRYVKIKAMMSAAANKDNTTQLGPQTVVPEAPKSTFRPISLFHDSGLGTSLPNRSQYASSNASHTSFLSTATDAEKGRLRVPRTPIEVREGREFVCFICAQWLSGIRNRVDWKMHVFEDLHPYICTLSDCPDGFTTYPTRKLWALHELKTHHSHQQYECHDCSRVFSVEKEFLAHISNDHQFQDLNHTQRLAIVSAAKRSVLNSFENQACPLCQKTGWKLQRDFATHLGKHLEEVALSSLPRDEESDSGSDSNTDPEFFTSVPPPYSLEPVQWFQPQITSYWSVPEQQKFPDLIRYFGRDFAAIADFMKTKSTTMVKNFYNRGLNIGHQELEDAAKRAEGMRERGESMGPLPTPPERPKRRYEATPSMASLPMITLLPAPGSTVGQPDNLPEVLPRDVREQQIGTKQQKRTSLANACSVGDLATVQAQYGEHPGHLNTADPEGYTPLHIAACAGSANVVKFLLERKCKINSQNAKLETPLTDAINNGSVEVVRMLLQSGAVLRLERGMGFHAGSLIRRDNPRADEIRKLIEEAMGSESASTLDDGLPHAGAQDSDEYTKKCICDHAEDGGNIVLCETCDTWQHIECYYTNQPIPDVHKCADCDPRELDVKKDTEHQKRVQGTGVHEHYRLRQLLSELQNHPSAWPCTRPIDLEKMPDYFEVIREPMDLFTMENRLNDGLYQAPEDFIKDAKLIFDNCRRYHGETTAYVKSVNKLEKYMWQQIGKIPEWADLISNR